MSAVSQWEDVRTRSHFRPLLTADSMELVLCARGRWQRSAFVYTCAGDNYREDGVSFVYDNIYVVPTQTNGSDVDNLEG